MTQNTTLSEREALLGKVKAFADEAREEIEAHQEWLADNPEQPDPGADDVYVTPGLILALEAYLSTPVAPAEPVAWRIRTARHDGSWGGWWISEERPDPDSYDGGYGFEIVELGPIATPAQPSTVTEEVAIDLEWLVERCRTWSSAKDEESVRALAWNVNGLIKEWASQAGPVTPVGWKLVLNKPAEPVAWLCTDLILGAVQVITDAHHAMRRAERPEEWSVEPLGRLATPAQPSTVTAEGWKLVPTEATVDMMAAYCHQMNTGTQEVGKRNNAERYQAAAYRAMLAVAPAPPATSPVTPEPKSAKRTMTINLTDEEISALEEIADAKGLEMPKVFRAMLKTEQLVVRGLATVLIEAGPLSSSPVTGALVDFSREATIAEASLAEAQDEIRRWKQAFKCLTADDTNFSQAVRDTVYDYGLEAAAQKAEG